MAELSDETFLDDDSFPAVYRTRYSFLLPKAMILARQKYWYFRNTNGKLDSLPKGHYYLRQKNLLQCIKRDILPLIEHHPDDRKSKFVFSSKIDSLLRKIAYKFETCKVNSLINTCCPITLQKKSPRKKSKMTRTQMNPLEECSMAGLLSLRTTKKQLFTLIHHIVHHAVCYEILGSERNLSKFESNLKTILTGEVRQTFYIWDLAAGLDMTAMRKNFEECYQSYKNRKDVLEIAILHWLYAQICNILKAKFYITESSSSSCPVYYRYDLWEAILQKEFSSQTFYGKWHRLASRSAHKPPSQGDKASDEDAVRISKLRLIPKTTNLRSIAYTKQLLTFKKAVPVGPYYVVRGNFRDCYPSIDQNKLYDLLVDTMTQFAAEYDADLETVLKFRILQLFKPQSKKTFREELLLEGTGSDLPEALRNEIHRKKLDFNLGLRESFTLQKVLDVLEAFIKQPELSHNRGRERFEMYEGVRQGVAFAPQLCEFYLQHLFNQYFASFFDVENIFLFRSVDDFLLITTDLDKAKEFVSICRKGFENFNMRDKFKTVMNVDKLELNFNSQGMLKKCKTFQFRGHTFHCDDVTLSVSLEKLILRPSPFTSLGDAFIQLTNQNRTHSMLLFEQSLCPSQLCPAFEYFLLNALRLSLYLSRHYIFRHRQIDPMRIIDELVSELARRLPRSYRNDDLKQSNLRLIAIHAFHLLWAKHFHHRSDECKTLSAFHKAMDSDNAQRLFRRLPRDLPERFVEFIVSFKGKQEETD